MVVQLSSSNARSVHSIARHLFREKSKIHKFSSRGEQADWDRERQLLGSGGHPCASRVVVLIGRVVVDGAGVVVVLRGGLQGSIGRHIRVKSSSCQ
jgi:hypothetical protein